MDTRKIFETIEVLLGPSGCAWSRRLDLKSILYYLIEEAYETLDAHEKGDLSQVEEELGDLIFNACYGMILATREYPLDPNTVISKVVEKCRRRHSYVFSGERPWTFEEIKEKWPAIKAAEKKEKKEGILDSLAHSSPQLVKIVKLKEAAQASGYSFSFEEGDAGDVLFQKILEMAEKGQNPFHKLEESIQKHKKNITEFSERKKPEMA